VRQLEEWKEEKRRNKEQEEEKKLAEEIQKRRRAMVLCVCVCENVFDCGCDSSKIVELRTC